MMGWIDGIRQLDVRERFADTASGAVLILAAGWLCFRSVFICFVGLILLPVYLKYRIEARQHRRQLALQREFKDAMAILYSSTAAGSTLEKAFFDAARDMRTSGERYPLLLPEFERIQVGLHRNKSMENVLTDFAERCRNEDISNFVQILVIARKSGGALSEIIRQTVETMTLRMEMNAEIENLLAGKRGELKIMMLVPAGILLYMNLGSEDYMQVLYTTLIGRCSMIAAMMVYFMAVLAGRRILDIHI